MIVFVFEKNYYTLPHSYLRIQYSYIRIRSLLGLLYNMTIEQFLFLNEVDKEEAIWRNGVFLKNSEDGNNLCDIYELFDFYVAFCYELDKNLKAKVIASTFQDSLPLLFKENALN